MVKAYLVLITFGEKDADAQDPTKANTELMRFDELVILVDENLTKRLRVGQKQSLAVEQMPIYDQAVVRYLFGPSCCRVTRRFVRDGTEMAVEETAALSAVSI